MQVHVISNIVKEYPEMIKVVIYKEPHYFISEKKLVFNKKKDLDREYVPKFSSICRTKTLIKDIIMCNDFEYFCTFTFAPDKVDRFSFPACWHKMSTWLHHQKDLAKLNNKNFQYLIVPEMHKSGAWHFHALISGYSGSLRPTKQKSSTSRRVYTITSFRSGFTTAVAIDSKEALCTYVAKYITKDFIKYFNQRRFFCSRGLIRPARRLNGRVPKMPPLFVKPVSENSDTFEYIIDKQFLVKGA